MIRACIFDVFGTTVDWRTSVGREVARFARDRAIAGLDAVGFADAWRALYQPSLEEVRSGRRPWANLDTLHRESLVALLARHGVTGPDAAQVDDLNHAWHRLDPWPDVVEGLTRLKARCVIAPCSNGNVALMVDMARRAGLPWDCILGAEVARAYKPQPEAYLSACRLLALDPGEVMMVAAHNSDLRAAKALGLATAFVRRPAEYGPAQSTDLAAEPGVADVAVASFLELDAWLARQGPPREAW